MTSIKRLGDDLPDNLPLLTQVVDENTLDDLPTLTEVVADKTTGETTSHLAWLPKDDSQVAGYEDQAESATGFQPNADQEVPAPEATIPASCAPNEEEMQRLLQQLETHLENVFTHKLSLNLEQLQRQAVEQAVSELKAELPELLRNALNAHPEL